MSFPPGTEMFQFPGFASTTYVFSCQYTLRCGFPHSEIIGSKPTRGSPILIAACHVLHRLLAPRHSPNALVMLDPYQKPDCLGLKRALTCDGQRTKLPGRVKLLTLFNRVFPRRCATWQHSKHTRSNLHCLFSISPLSSHKEETGDRHIYNFKDSTASNACGVI